MDYEIREFRDGDEESLLETFNHVFADQDPSFEPRTLDEWRWSTHGNPAGWRIWVALHSGRVVAQYAAWPMRMVTELGERHFAQIIDSMVHPEHRAGLKRPGLFVRTAWDFFDAYGAPDKDLVHYGMPIENAWRMGKRFLKYELMRTHGVLAREAGDDPGLPSEVERIERFDEQARWLYDRCAGDWGVSALRDEAFWNWRFLDHPRRRYECLGVRDGDGILRGAAIYRQADWVLPNMGLVIDWLVPPGEPEVGELLERGLRSLGARDRVSAMACLTPDWSPWFERFQGWGWRVHPSDYFMVSRNFHARF
ncbi:MAG: GNAT family N-acetyltransferase, partial [Planctomycetota bacterium]